MRYAWVRRSEPVMFCGYLLAWQVVLLHIFSPLVHSVRHPHKVELSVGDRKSFLVDAHPRLPLGDGFWEFFALLIQSVGGLNIYYEEAYPDYVC